MSSCRELNIAEASFAGEEECDAEQPILSIEGRSWTARATIPFPINHCDDYAALVTIFSEYTQAEQADLLGQLSAQASTFQSHLSLLENSLDKVSYKFLPEEDSASNAMYSPVEASVSDGSTGSASQALSADSVLD